MKEDPEDGLSEEMMMRVREMFTRLLSEAMRPFTPAIPPLNFVAAQVRQCMLDECEQEGVDRNDALAAINFDLRFVGPGEMVLTARNVFTFLLTIHVVRDPKILASFITRVPLNDVEDGWREDFTDERGTYSVVHFPPNRFENILIPHDPVNIIHVDIDLPGDSK